MWANDSLIEVPSTANDLPSPSPCPAPPQSSSQPRPTQLKEARPNLDNCDLGHLDGARNPVDVRNEPLCLQSDKTPASGASVVRPSPIKAAAQMNNSLLQSSVSEINPNVQLQSTMAVLSSSRPLRPSNRRISSTQGPRPHASKGLTTDKVTKPLPVLVSKPARRFKPLITEPGPLTTYNTAKQAPKTMTSSSHALSLEYPAMNDMQALELLHPPASNLPLLKNITLPPTDSQWKTACNWAIYLSQVSNAELRTCALVSTEIRSGGAHSLLRHPTPSG